MTKWTSTAGPIQTKRVAKALERIQRRAIETVELCNMDHDGRIEEYAMVSARYGSMSGGLAGEPTQAQTDIAYAYEQLGERFGWAITRETAAAVLAAAEETDKRAAAMRPTIDKRKTAEQFAEERAQRAMAVIDNKAEERKRAEVVDTFIAKAPTGARAAITATYERDDSDMQSDYFHSHALGTFLIGWRFGAREDFRQLRAAAERFAAGVLPVIHCDGRAYASSTCPHGSSEPHDTTDTPGEWTEHRDNYSMGRGNYLSDHGHASSGTGWIVRSVDLSYRNGLPLDAPDYTHPTGTEEPRPVTGEGFTVTPSSTGKPGYVEVHFAAKPDEQTRNELKASGFRWALRSACWYGPETRLPERYRMAVA